MWFGTSEVEIVNIVIQLRSLVRNEEKTSNFRKGEYDVMLSVKFEGDELKIRQETGQNLLDLNSNEKQFNVEVIEITNLYQPFKEEEIVKSPTKRNTLKKELTKKNTTTKSKKTKQLVAA